MASSNKVNPNVAPPLPARQPEPAKQGGSIAKRTPAATPEARPPQNFGKYGPSSRGIAGGVFSPNVNPANQPLDVKGMPPLSAGEMLVRYAETVGDNPSLPELQTAYNARNE